jgi:hypothetical protein
MLFGLPDDHPAVKYIRRLEEIEHAVRARYELPSDAPDVDVCAAELLICLTLDPDNWERVPGTDRWRKIGKGK